MQPKNAADRNERERPAEDSVERALNEIGDRWVFLILREAFFGVRRFDEFQARTGAAKNILADRLKRLVSCDIFEKRPYGSHPNRFEYRLTDKGRDLYPMIVLLMRWGDRWLSEGAPPLILVHKSCGSDVAPRLACDVCGEPIDARDMDWRPA